MQDRPQNLIKELELAPHPEGGYYREIYRSEHEVTWRGERLSAATAIYFLLLKGDKSWWHRIPQDEVWHYYDGDPLELVSFADADTKLGCTLLSTQTPVAIIPGGVWQAARTTGAYTLIGCTVAPGFEFRLFELLDKQPGRVERCREEVEGFSAFTDG